MKSNKFIILIPTHGITIANIPLKYDIFKDFARVEFIRFASIKVVIIIEIK